MFTSLQNGEGFLHCLIKVAILIKIIHSICKPVNHKYHLADNNSDKLTNLWINMNNLGIPSLQDLLKLIIKQESSQGSIFKLSVIYLRNCKYLKQGIWTYFCNVC